MLDKVGKWNDRNDSLRVLGYSAKCNFFPLLMFGGYANIV